MDVNERLQVEDRTEKTDGRRFRSIVGGLIYLTRTRPDISFVVGVVSRFMSDPSKQHFGVAKRILRYIAGTLSFGIWYTKVLDSTLTGVSGRDWASLVEDRRNTSGNVFSLGSGAITWCSKRQPTVALSTTEAELRQCFQLVNVFG
ncbi:secreted RxLR effector protein 161-like [Andrographis paniculata]|uniref:secreted RxLR effector protein 161-like n=1 Tax=Andrographis paniculata TaxID=175694 RepID=UPI0021E716F9|nr:secreted RxLR effector protein 161-like [Andrographis paniculata]